MPRDTRKAVLDRNGALTFRSHPQVERFFAGLDLAEPGVVRIPEWRPDSDLDRVNPAEVWGGVARKP